MVLADYLLLLGRGEKLTISQGDVDGFLDNTISVVFTDEGFTLRKKISHFEIKQSRGNIFPVFLGRTIQEFYRERANTSTNKRLAGSLGKEN